MSADRLERLYVAHGSAIYVRCLRLLGDRAAAEDATQETFLRVHTHLGVPEGDADSLRWIFRIATNLCLTMLRDRKPQDELVENTLRTSNLEEILAKRDLARRVILRVPEKLRLPAWLHYVDGLGMEEVASVIGVTSRTVANRLDAFRARAQKLIGKEGP